MDRSEAAQILGLRETALTKARIKEAHRRMMIANHPDRGGAPYLASKVNEAKVRRKEVGEAVLAFRLTKLDPFHSQDLLDKITTK